MILQASHLHSTTDIVARKTTWKIRSSMVGLIFSASVSIGLLPSFVAS